jgi:hypothetical protein
VRDHAKIGLGANLVEGAINAVLFHGEAGNTPVGETDYVLHFDDGPPSVGQVVVRQASRTLTLAPRRRTAPR